MQRTKLSDAGEFGLIERLTKNFSTKNKSSLKAVGDDAAVCNYGNKRSIITTDILVEGIHYNLKYMPLKHLGYKAVIVNLSDIYAMNAQAQQITVSIGVSSKFYIEALEEIYAGIELACNRYGVDLIGGDTTAVPSGSLISITALGMADAEKIVYRSTAKAGDLLCVSGDLGAAYAGLQILEREQKLFDSDPSFQPVLKTYEYVVQRQLKPEARRDIIRILDQSGVLPTAMIDISDGLSSELFHICKQSGTGVKIYEEKIPIAQETDKVAEEMRLDTSLFALNGGEDYELLFAISPGDLKKIEKNPYFSIIGTLTEKDEKIMIAKDGTGVELKAQGWLNFK